jgi:hypothetical protein
MAFSSMCRGLEVDGSLGHRILGPLRPVVVWAAQIGFDPIGGCYALHHFWICQAMPSEEGYYDVSSRGVKSCFSVASSHA